jgi:antitoxin PrlF
MATATLTSKGQITLPKEVREHFHLGAGDRLEFVIGRGGDVRVQPLAGSYRDLQGMLRRRGSPSPSDRILDQELTQLMEEDDQRIRRGGA